MIICNDNRISKTLQRRSTLSLGSTQLASYAYGATDGRLATLGNGAATLEYSYVPGTNRLAKREWTSGTPPSPLLTQEYGYDAYGRLTGITVNGAPEIAYTLDADSRRTAAALGDETTWSYGYDGKGQLLSAEREDENEMPLNAMSYAYDEIGNRLTASEDLAAKTYTANDLNQYTVINAETVTYDADGNMLTNDGWSYTWNCENRLVAAEKAAIRLEFAYDYMGRRVYKKVYDSNTPVKHEKYVYDDYKLIAIFDGLNSDALLKTFVWQPSDLDVPLCMTIGTDIYYYITDGNKNVTGLTDATGARVATYLYGPFGQTLSSTGAIAALNPFRFSSEFHDDETGLVYYNYRYYSPKLGRWTKRDPIGVPGGVNLYGLIKNDAVSRVDYLGLKMYAIDGTWGHYTSEELGKSVVQRFYENCIEQGRYWAGPSLPSTALDSPSILKKVTKKICDDYCASKNMEINLVGWSRGAVIAINVARALKEKGCCCDDRPSMLYPSVNWIGLFDAVDMHLLNMSHNISDNVKSVTHIEKEQKQLLFPTVDVGVDDENKTSLEVVVLPGSTHGDVGGNRLDNHAGRVNASLNFMIEAAIKAGVKVKYKSVW